MWLRSYIPNRNNLLCLVCIFRIGLCLNNRAAALTRLGLVFIAAQAGGALFPTITGLIANSVGVRVLQPIVIALVVGALCTWLLVPKPQRRED